MDAIGHIGTSNKRSAENHFEADREAVIAIGIELGWRDVLGDREIAPGGLKILTDGSDVDLGGRKITKKLLDFRRRFAETGHETRLGERVGAIAFCELEHAQRLLVIGLWAHAAVEAAHGFHIVIEDVGGGIEHARDGVEIAAKIRREHFDLGSGKRGADLAHGFGEVKRAAVGEIVAIDGCDHDIAQVHARRHFGDMRGLIGIEREFALGRRGFRHGTKTAAARAKIAEDHEGRRAAMEAFMDVWTAGGFAHGMQVPPAELGLQLMHRFEMGPALAQPRGQPRLSGRAANLDESAHAASFWHASFY